MFGNCSYRYGVPYNHFLGISMAYNVLCYKYKFEATYYMLLGLIIMYEDRKKLKA
jgi:hypothetical protein